MYRNASRSIRRPELARTSKTIVSKHSSQVVMAQRKAMVRASARDVRTPACILGSGITVLGVIRLLGKAGISAQCASDARGIEADSRYFQPVRNQAGEEITLSDFRPAQIEALIQAVGSRNAVFIPCNDHALVGVAEFARKNAEIQCCIPPLEAIRTCTDKALFAEALDKFSVPHPRTLAPDDPWLRSGGAGGEFFVKPTDSQAFFREFGVKAFRISGGEELKKRLSEAGARGLTVVVQEYVPGPASAHIYVEGFFDRNGRERASCARRRLRMYPPDFGNSTSMISIDLEQVRPAHNDLKRLLEGLSYRGVYSAEFKHDARDGSFKIIEINARPWWYVEFIGDCGINIPEMIYRDALGLEVPEARGFVAGRRVSYLYYDIFAVRHLRECGKYSWGAAILDWCRSGFVIWSWSDVRPGIVSALQCVKSWIRSRISRRAK